MKNLVVSSKRGRSENHFEIKHIFADTQLKNAWVSIRKGFQSDSTHFLRRGTFFDSKKVCESA